MTKKKKIKKVTKTLKGVVVSDKMEKTAVVEITSIKFQKLYRKYFKNSKRFKAHNPDNKYKTGQKVIIEAARPLSKGKRWYIKSLA